MGTVTMVWTTWTMLRTGRRRRGRTRNMCWRLPPKLRMVRRLMSLIVPVMWIVVIIVGLMEVVIVIIKERIVVLGLRVEIWMEVGWWRRR